MTRRMMQLVLERLLSFAGIRVNGNSPWDMQVKDQRVFATVLRHGSLGLGETYMKGWWECSALDEFFYKLLSANLDLFGMFNPVALLQWLKDRFTNAARRDRAFEVGEMHYDLGNDLFQKMLDGRMVYSCAYWTRSDETLEDAQEEKLDLVCRKLQLSRAQRLLDIGCGWGSLARFAAERYGVSVVGVTVSKEQCEAARMQCRDLPVEIRLQDYREVEGTFDRIASLGMFEHVERKNYDAFFSVVRRCLAADGLFLLHTIGERQRIGNSDPFTRKYIFPQGMIPVQRYLRRQIQKYFSILDWHTFGSQRYDRTLMAWRSNFREHWPELVSRYAGKLNGQFQRMWEYYLSSCAGAFRAKRLDVWQIVMGKSPISYAPVR